MSGEDALRVEVVGILGSSGDIPQADVGVLRGRQEMTSEIGRPRKTVP